MNIYMISCDILQRGKNPSISAGVGHPEYEREEKRLREIILFNSIYIDIYISIKKVNIDIYIYRYI